MATKYRDASTAIGVRSSDNSIEFENLRGALSDGFQNVFKVRRVLTVDFGALCQEPVDKHGRRQVLPARVQTLHGKGRAQHSGCKAARGKANATGFGLALSHVR